MPGFFYTLLFWLALATFVVAQGWIVVSTIRAGRAITDPDLRAGRNTPLELFWLVLPAIVLGIVTYLSWLSTR